MSRSLRREVRESLSLIVFTAATMGVSVGLGLLVVQLLG
jgi:hypothetical protein